MTTQVAWMGGSRPPDNPPVECRILAWKFYRFHVVTYKTFWGNMPDADIKETFKNWARYDAWATYRETL